MKLICIILFTLLTQPIVANAEDIYWPGIGYISEEDLPDDGTGTSGAAVMEEADQSPIQVTGPITISLEDIEETSQAQEPVVVITPDPVIQEVIQVDPAPEPDSVEVLQEDIQEDILDETIEEEPAVLLLEESEEDPAPETEITDISAASESVQEESAAITVESTSQAAETVSQDATQSEDQQQFNLVLILCIGFVAGCLVAFALFRAMR